MASCVCFFREVISLHSFTSSSILVHITLDHRLFNSTELCPSRYLPSIPQNGSGPVSIGNDKSAPYVYTRDDLIDIRRMGTCKLGNSAFLNVKSNGIFRYRGVRSGKAVKTRRQINQSMVPTIITANRPRTINTRSVNAANVIYPSTVESP